ncbi:biotin--[acetyl-CoA-carboxylase] ligase [Rhodoflexus sp.]
MYKIAADTLFTGKKLIHLPVCRSTNDIAAELIQTDPVIAGTVIIADCQTQGRGQRGSTWEAAPGLNLTLSLIWCPSFLNGSDAFLLNMAVALGVADTVSKLLPDAVVAIKWPNDIYADGSKICGILIENTLQGTKLRYSVVGIGLNVNQTDFGELHATSLKLQSGLQQLLPEVFDLLIRHLEKRYLQLQAQGSATVKEAYLANLYQLGQLASYTDLRGDVPSVFEGTIEDIDATGRLLIRTQAGIEAFGFKQIRFNC